MRCTCWPVYTLVQSIPFSTHVIMLYSSKSKWSSVKISYKPRREEKGERESSIFKLISEFSLAKKQIITMLKVNTEYSISTRPFKTHPATKQTNNEASVDSSALSQQRTLRRAKARKNEQNRGLQSVPGRKERCVCRAASRARRVASLTHHLDNTNEAAAFYVAAWKVTSVQGK